MVFLFDKPGAATAIFRQVLVNDVSRISDILLRRVQRTPRTIALTDLPVVLSNPAMRVDLPTLESIKNWS